MCITVGVRFLFVKVPVSNGFAILFNDNQLHDDSEIITVEPSCLVRGKDNHWLCQWKKELIAREKVGRNKKAIKEYIANQLQADQMSIKEFVDTFTGSKNTKA